MTGNDRHALRDVAMSDWDVLRRAADLALNDRNLSFTPADRERLKIFKKRLELLDEKQTQRQGYLQAKRDILSGREAKELNAEERDELRGVKKAGRHLAMLADFGAEGGSRTLARVFKPPTPLAGEPLRPLGYFCRTI